MKAAPSTPSPNVSEEGTEMVTDEEEDLLAYTGLGREDDASSKDGFEHV